MCIFSLSHTKSISALNNYCQSWIRTCQSCRKESNPFLQTFKANMNLLCCLFSPFFFFFPFFFSTIPLHVILFEYLSMNEFSEGVVHKKSLGRSSAGVQLAAVTLHSVTSWKCITVNVKSSLVGYSPQCSHQLSQLKDFRYWVRGPNNSMGLTPSN